MRVLLTTPSGLGHVHPMVPLALALKERGHEVRWATAADTMATVRDAGIDVVRAGMDQHDRAPEFWRRNPEVRSLPPDQVPEVMFPKMFGGVAAPPMLDDLLAIVGDWRPDLIVHDAAELAAPIVAASLDVPNVVKTFGLITPRSRVEAAAEEVAPLWRSAGLEPRPFAGCYDHLLLDVFPPTLQGPADYVPKRQALRPVAYDTAESTSTIPLPASSGRPLVYVTMGTVFNEIAPLRAAVDALATLDVDVLVTVGPNGDPAALGDQPSQIRVERYVPQTLVLDRCDLVVSHAGSGTVLATLGLGLPQLCLPQGADQFGNAAAVTKAGAGLALPPAEAAPAVITGAVERLLTDTTFRSAAGLVADTIAAMPSPDEVAAVLESIA